MDLKTLKSRIESLERERQRFGGRVLALREDLKASEEQLQTIVGHLSEAKYWLKEAQAQEQAEDTNAKPEFELVPIKGGKDGDKPQDGDKPKDRAQPQAKAQDQEKETQK